MTAIPAPTRPLASRPGLRLLRIGYVPLTDAAPLLVAEALGLFEAVGLRVSLSAEPGWAALRDRLAFGALDAAHLLGPLPIALAAGLGGVRSDVVVAAGLGANGNTVTLSQALAEEIGAFDAPLSPTAFAAAIRARAAAGKPVVTLAVVFPFSSHNYLLRHWLSEGGLDPDRDLRLTVVPPPQVAQRLAAGAIDGFCAGEPWGSHAAALGAGRIALSTGDIWPGHPEKLLAFHAEAITRERDAAIACTAAVIAAARWMDAPQNHDDAVRILARRAFPLLARQTIAAALDGRAGATTLAHPLRFRAATKPRRAEAAWWLGQMRRWGHVPDAVADDDALAPWADDSLWQAAAARIAEPEPATPPSPPVFPTPETAR